MKRNTELTGRVVFWDDPLYPGARLDFNRRFSKFPLLVVFCQETQDVRNAIRWARERGVPLRIRSGRHSFEAFSLVDGGIIIDVSGLNQIRADHDGRIARIGAGAQLLPLYRALDREGLTIPGGTCPTVGIAGLTLGGGFGMLTRLLGMLCDHLTGLEMVTADGEIILADLKRNPDLFWASRGGGGGNFGVVTSFAFKAFPISNVAIFNIVWDWSAAEEVIKVWQEWAPGVDNRLTSIIRLFTPQDGRILSSGEFVGSADELRCLLKPLLAVGRPNQAAILTVPYFTAVETFGGIGPIAAQFGIAESRPSKFKHTGSYVLQALPAPAIRTMIDFMAVAPSSINSIEFQSLAGAVRQIAPQETAYFYREAGYNLHYKAQWLYDRMAEANIRWVENLRQTMLPWTAGAYVNFPDVLIADWPRAYYGANWERLKQVKREYDPENVFRFPQSIPPAENRQRF